MRLVYFWVVFLPILLRLGSLSQKRPPQRGGFFGGVGERDLNDVNAARMSAAGDGLTEPHNNFRPFPGENANQIPPSPTTPTGWSFLYYSFFNIH